MDIQNVVSDLRSQRARLGIRDIYLTPPAPTCSVRDRERGLSPDFAGVGATLQLRRGLCVYVDDQEKALRFYTEVLGFAKKADFSQGPFRWLTVASPEDPDGT